MNDKMKRLWQFLRGLFTVNQEDRELREWARGLSSEERGELLSDLTKQFLDDLRSWWMR